MNLKKRSFAIILIIGVILIGAAVFYEFIYLPGLKALPSPAMLQSWQFTVDKTTTNLQGGSMIQVQFTLQTPNASVTAELGNRASQVDDAVIGVVHSLSAADIMQAGGREALKSKVMASINRFLTSGKITGVYIDTLIVQ